MNNVVIVLSALLAVCLAQYYPGGAPAPVQETPEVAAARAAHFRLVAESNAAKANAPAPSQQGGNYNGQFGYAGLPNTYNSPAPYSAPQQYGPPPAPFSAPGYQQQGAYPAPGYPQQSAYSSPNYGGPTGGYQGPLAGVPKITNLGVPEYTPEVQAARAAALAAHSGHPPAAPPSYNQGPHYG